MVIRGLGIGKGEGFTECWGGSTRTPTGFYKGSRRVLLGFRCDFLRGHGLGFRGFRRIGSII